MVEVQVCVDDDVDPGEIEVLLAQWPEAGIEVGHRRVQLLDAGVDQHARIGMVDDVHVDRHPLALGEQVGNADWRDGDRGGGVHRSAILFATTRSTASRYPGIPPMKASRSFSSSRSVSSIVTSVFPSRSSNVTVSV